MDTITQGERLFNCLPGAAAPDWADFVSLYIGGCIDHEGHTEGGVSCDRAQFFTVYGVDAEGYAEAITDTATGDTLADAARIGAELAALSGLPCTLHPSLDPAAHSTRRAAPDRPEPRALPYVSAFAWGHFAAAVVVILAILGGCVAGLASLNGAG